MSAAMSRRFVAALAADEERRAAARKRAAERKALARLRCDRCKTRLLRPAALCNFCDESFDLNAALAALDNKESPAATGLSTTQSEGTR